EMALAEGAALGVLSSQADWRAVRQDGGEGKRFGVRPVDLAIGRVEDLGAAFPLASELGREREAFGNRMDIPVELAQSLLWHAGIDTAARRRRRNLLAEIRRAIGDRAANAGEIVQRVLQHAFGLASCDGAFLHQLLR